MTRLTTTWLLGTLLLAAALASVGSARLLRDEAAASATSDNGKLEAYVYKDGKDSEATAWSQDDKPSGSNRDQSARQPQPSADEHDNQQQQAERQQSQPSKSNSDTQQQEAPQQKRTQRRRTPTKQTNTEQQPQQSGNTGGDAVSDSVLKTVLDMHNDYRARHGVGPLTWSSQLQATAQDWANGCVFEHSQKPKLGENLAQGYKTFADGVRVWYDEVSQYSFSDATFSHETGHFTQMVWKGTTQLGCGYAACSGRPLYVCNYSPAGNVIGKFRDNVLPAGAS